MFDGNITENINITVILLPKGNKFDTTGELEPLEN